MTLVREQNAYLKSPFSRNAQAFYKCDNIYHETPYFEILPDIFTSLMSRIFDKPLCESNAVRRVKITGGISKEGN